ncbi:hypothetical protein DSO57_1020994 [Entomophthora muscae]|uniref:Uncharacterized protein n=1 Tax=Entomophthora muscae TaxID=34485 RepID=A0ACC2RIB5_9FUNG|nr:hypothetical protein DSO57_1020994 [Entomophthora muscae]
MPSLEASPAGAAAWGHRDTSQESKDEGPTAFSSHHCSHPGPLGPAMVSRVNSPGLEPIRPLNTIGEDVHSLSVNHADLGEPIRLDGNNKFNAKSASVVNNGIHHVSISPLVGHFEDKSLAFAFDSRNELASALGNMIVWFPDSAATHSPHSCLWRVILPSW